MRNRMITEARDNLSRPKNGSDVLNSEPASIWL